MDAQRFVAIDVETANPWLGSICQIGLAVFEGDMQWSSVFGHSLLSIPVLLFCPIRRQPIVMPVWPEAAVVTDHILGDG